VSEHEQLDEQAEPVIGRHAAAAVGAELRDAADRDEAEAELEHELADAPADEAAPDETMAKEAAANARYIKAVIKAIGPEQPIAPCPHCSGLGFNSLELAPDQHRGQCDECQGRGMVATGSRVDGQHVLPCMKCNGNGWVTIYATPTVAAHEPPPIVGTPDLLIPHTVLAPASMVG
jgi:hypothetical protein